MRCFERTLCIAEVQDFDSLQDICACMQNGKNWSNYVNAAWNESLWSTYKLSQVTKVVSPVVEKAKGIRCFNAGTKKDPLLHEVVIIPESHQRCLKCDKHESTKIPCEVMCSLW